MEPTDVLFILLMVALFFAFLHSRLHLWNYNGRQRLSVTMVLIINQIKIEGKMEKLKMSDHFRATVALKPKDTAGDPCAVDPNGSEFTCADETLATVEKVDEKTFRIIGVKDVAADGDKVVNVHWKLDADRGEGIVTLEGDIEVTLTATQATDVDVEIGVPEHQ